jgi:hypothetical protein
MAASVLGLLDKRPAVFPGSATQHAIMAPGAGAVALYFFVIGYWALGAMTAAIAAFSFYRWRRLRP